MAKKHVWIMFLIMWYCKDQIRCKHYYINLFSAVYQWYGKHIRRTFFVLLFYYHVLFVVILRVQN